MGCTVVFLPTAPFIFINAIDKHRLQWILVYIAEKCGEIREVVYKLAAKDVEETHVVLIVLKHLLFVHATKYGVINVSR